MPILDEEDEDRRNSRIGQPSRAMRSLVSEIILLRFLAALFLSSVLERFCVLSSQPRSEQI